MIAGVVMSALIVLAPDPRVGYLLYPINFFVWAYLLAEPAGPPDLMPADAGLPAPGGPHGRAPQRATTG